MCQKALRLSLLYVHFKQYSASNSIYNLYVIGSFLVGVALLFNKEQTTDYANYKESTTPILPVNTSAIIEHAVSLHVCVSL